MSAQLLDEDDDAAPFPSVPRSSNVGDTPRTSQRTSTEQRRRKRSQKSPNDVHVKPASQDVISDLLDSLTSIYPPAGSFPSPVGPVDVYSRPLTPPQESRPGSRSGQRHYSLTNRPPSLKPAGLTHDFIEVSHPSEDPADLPPEEDAAMPPVVRTSRPPSGFSRATASGSESLSRSIARKISSPSVTMSPQPERTMSLRGTPRQVKSPTANGAGTPQRLDSARQSTESKRNWIGIPSTQNSASKGKAREIYSPRTSSLRSAAYEGQRAGGRVFSAPMTARGSAAASARASMDTDRPVGVAGPSFSKASTRGEVFNEDDEYVKHTSGSAQAYTETEDGRMIPQRRSSLLASSRSTSPAKTRLSAQSTGSSPQERSRKQDVTVSGSPLPPQTKRVTIEEDSDDNEVSRRIKELQQQSEERRRLRELDPATQAKLPPKRKSSKPSREASEHRGATERESQQDDYALGIPPIATVESKPLKQSSRTASKDRGAPGLNSINKSTPRPSHEFTKHSRNSSQSKRWSPITFGNKADQNRRPEADRSQSPLVLRAASMDTRRPSVDSVRASAIEYLSSNRLSQSIEIVGERRKVVFSEVGDPKGYAVLCCVGMGLTRYIMAFYDELATSLGLRLITPDRPGIGESDAYTDGPRTPMSWPDDVQAICEHLNITKFALLAHSAGAVYALATALRLPHYLRGKIHLLAPWIPPSQLTPANNAKSSTAAPAGSLPKSQRFLRMLPSSLLRLSNGSFSSLSSRSASPKAAKYPSRGRRSTETGTRGTPRPSMHAQGPSLPVSYSTSNLHAPTIRNTQPPSPHIDSFRKVPQDQHNIAAAVDGYGGPASIETPDAKKLRQRAYDETLTPMIWDLATANANPSVDLLICLERHRTIGFSYVDVGATPAMRVVGERPGRYVDLGSEVDGNQWPEMGVVIHHGSKDARVPVENVRWLSQRMVQCEVKILDGLGHGLMGEASVMGGILADIAKEWDSNGGFKQRRSAW